METSNQTPEEIKAELHQEFVKSINQAAALKPREWMYQHRISPEETGAGYIPVNFNQGAANKRKRELVERAGMLIPFNTNGANVLFGRIGIIFPLRNENGGIVNFYAVELETGKTSHLNEQGLYPGYPKPETEKLYITKNIIDAATILECKILKEDEAVIALCDGEWMKAHYEAIKRIKNLQELILIE